MKKNADITKVMPVTDITEEMPVTEDISKKGKGEASTRTISVFVPLNIKKRGGGTFILTPKDKGPKEDQADSKHFNHPIIKAIAKAYKWKIMIETGQISSLGEIAQKEKLKPPYVSRVFSLNFLSPRIVEGFLNGNQSRKLNLRSFITGEIPDLWEEQEERWGI
jgi:hypothetical protein